ncbi:MAG: hypothetical protein QF781_07505 [Phycisphaerales bacterium]|jgi:hypothetical protein|nr:hypothetical protein [Phycisphaerales bacterium]MDP7086760.1 hypothetical protein [Phycisphaerales bacterium]MDP7189189.1 hypothetical protein [Phycisphaerales bacterium]|tara:strand:- start:1970 stop:2122 length:153 start_codon:yes stop_codon:yes gene_type:complete
MRLRAIMVKANAIPIIAATVDAPRFGMWKPIVLMSNSMNNTPSKMPDGNQ